MKKIIVALLLWAMLMPMLMSVGAVGEEIPQLTFDHVEKELLEAYSYLVAYGGFRFFSYLSGSIKTEVDPSDTYSIYAGTAGLPDLVYERSTKLVGTALNYGSSENVVLNISTRTDLLNVLKNHYTESAANAFVSSLTDTLMSVRIKKNDALYIKKDLKNSALYKEFPYNISEIEWADKIEVNGNSAVAYVFLSVSDINTLESKLMHISVSFELVEGKWRLADNVFFTKIFTQEADKYIVEFENYKTPMTPSLDGDTLSISDISWLVETSNELLMALSSEGNTHYEEDPCGVWITAGYSFDNFRPYEEKDKPEHIRNASFGKLLSLNFSRPLYFNMKIEDSSDLSGFVREFFTPSAAENFIDSLTNRMNLLYFSGDDVYINMYGFRREADIDEIIKVNDIKSIEYNGTRANAELELLVQPRYEFDKKTVIVPMEFKKTEGGWRLSKNPYGSELHSDYMDSLPDNYRDAFPEICPLPDLTGDLTRKSAELLAERAYRIFTVFSYGSIANIRTNGEADPYYEDFSIIRKEISNSLIIYDTEIGDEFFDYQVVNTNREFDFLGRRLTSLNDVNAMLSEFITDNVASCMNTCFGKYKTFCEDRSGRLLMFTPGYFMDYYYLDSFGSFKQSGNRATLEVFMIKQGNTNDDEENKDYIEGLWDEKVNVTFQKTKDGWRISGGTMFSLLYGDTYTETEPSPSPETGDATPMLWLISVISLAGMCAVIRKRKTR